MSLRGTARTLDDRVAELEALMRRRSSDQAVRPIDVRFLYNARGGILVTRSPNDPVELPLGPPESVLKSNGTMAVWTPIQWIPVSILAQGAVLVGGDSGPTTVPPPHASGLVLTSDLAQVRGPLMSWQ